MSSRHEPARAARPRHLQVVDDAMAGAAEERAVDAAREHCLSLLATRARTRFELAEALRRRGADPTVAGRVLDRLEEVGLVDDCATARAYADKEAGRKGPRAIAAALQRRGIDACLAMEIAFARSADDVRAAALALARHSLPSRRGQPVPVVERRLAGMLARRGYPTDVILSVVREVVDVPDDDPIDLDVPVDGETAESPRP